MAPIVVVIAAGEMGAAVGGRLREHGVDVRTSLAGRSAKTAERARRHGLVALDDDARLLQDAAFVLSIVPPAEAVPLARRLAPALADGRAKPVYVDCNAVSPATVAEVADAIARTGCAFVDAGIIGGPPRPGTPGPKFYACGAAALRFAALREHGLDVRAIDGEIGTASALKMAYGSITKGFTAIGAAAMLAATTAGVADLLKRELADSQPALKAWLDRQMPNAYAKAYRWIAEMEEVSGFVGEPSPSAQMFKGVARLYEQLARSYEGDRREIEALSNFVKD
jgi:3-hydroxyisobutyrate dehydrogenase-like beta-hydroxyacid dehydrogenase